MNLRDLPALCGFHERGVRHIYYQRDDRYYPPDEEFVRQQLMMAVSEPTTCHYCLTIQGVQRFDCCEFIDPPSPDHEHKWVRRTDEPWALGRHDHLHTMWCASFFDCAECGSSIQDIEVFRKDAFPRTCQRCGKKYRDADPFSEFCSRECVETAKLSTRFEGNR